MNSVQMRSMGMSATGSMGTSPKPVGLSDSILEKLAERSDRSLAASTTKLREIFTLIDSSDGNIHQARTRLKEFATSVLLDISSTAEAAGTETQLREFIRPFSGLTDRGTRELKALLVSSILSMGPGSKVIVDALLRLDETIGKLEKEDFSGAPELKMLQTLDLGHTIDAQQKSDAAIKIQAAGKRFLTQIGLKRHAMLQQTPDQNCVHIRSHDQHDVFKGSIHAAKDDGGRPAGYTTCGWVAAYNASALYAALKADPAAKAFDLHSRLQQGAPDQFIRTSTNYVEDLSDFGGGDDKVEGNLSGANIADILARSDNEGFKSATVILEGTADASKIQLHVPTGAPSRTISRHSPSQCTPISELITKVRDGALSSAIVVAQAPFSESGHYVTVAIRSKEPSAESNADIEFVIVESMNGKDASNIEVNYADTSIREGQLIRWLNTLAYPPKSETCPLTESLFGESHKTLPFVFPRSEYRCSLEGIWDEIRSNPPCPSREAGTIASFGHTQFQGQGLSQEFVAMIERHIPSSGVATETSHLFLLAMATYHGADYTAEYQQKYFPDFVVDDATQLAISAIKSEIDQILSIPEQEPEFIAEAGACDNHSISPAFLDSTSSYQDFVIHGYMLRFHATPLTPDAFIADHLKALQGDKEKNYRVFIGQINDYCATIFDHRDPAVVMPELNRQIDDVKAAIRRTPKTDIKQKNQLTKVKEALFDQLSRFEAALELQAAAQTLNQSGEDVGEDVLKIVPKALDINNYNVNVSRIGSAISNLKATCEAKLKNPMETWALNLSDVILFRNVMTIEKLTGFWESQADLATGIRHLTGLEIDSRPTT